ncbi:uncharacterized protein [Miscanthus floridulus]|uniref:uncharacterized protein n=1 Tax=Miscanthus floridulus TaxID=154761 RepID=UPI003458344A
MNHNRNWNVLCWNVRALNAVRKWDAIRNKVGETNCDIVCLQETKKDNFDAAFVRKILPATFDDYLFVPSAGASGGLLVAWKFVYFEGNLKFANNMALAIDFSSKHNDSLWTLMNVYGPYTLEGKREFITWLQSLDISNDEDWIILGDFNLYRYPENRNREGADINEMFLFNSCISHLGLTKIFLHGKKYTWSNMQNLPLLERLDWVLTNNSWTLSYPETTSKALIMEVSDHSPLVISISTDIPKAHIFRFENYWLLREGFQDILSENWFAHNSLIDKAKIITNKFKNLRAALKVWSSNLSNLHCKYLSNSATLGIFGGIQRLKIGRMELQVHLKRKASCPSGTAKGILEAKRCH